MIKRHFSKVFKSKRWAVKFAYKISKTNGCFLDSFDYYAREVRWTELHDSEDSKDILYCKGKKKL